MVEISAPFYVGIQITGNCNLKCLYCYSSNSPKIFINPAKLYEIIERLSSLGVFQYLIEGGEPMIHPEFVAIVEKLLKYEIDFVILSNGVFLNKAKIIEINDICINNIPKIQISIDSHIPKINDISRGYGQDVINNIWDLIEYGIHPTLATVVHAQNYKYIYDFIDYFYPSIKEFHFMNLMRTKATDRNIDLLFMKSDDLSMFWNQFINTHFPDDLKITHPYKSINKYLGYGSYSCDGCLAGITSVNILPNMDVTACPIASDYILGNLDKNDFNEIWHSDEAEQIRKINIPLCIKK